MSARYDCHDCGANVDDASNHETVCPGSLADQIVDLDERLAELEAHAECEATERRWQAFMCAALQGSAATSGRAPPEIAAAAAYAADLADDAEREWQRRFGEDPR